MTSVARGESVARRASARPGAASRPPAEARGRGRRPAGRRRGGQALGDDLHDRGVEEHPRLDGVGADLGEEGVQLRRDVGRGDRLDARDSLRPLSGDGRDDGRSVDAVRGEGLEVARDPRAARRVEPAIVSTMKVGGDPTDLPYQPAVSGGSPLFGRLVVLWSRRNARLRRLVRGRRLLPGKGRVGRGGHRVAPRRGWVPLTRRVVRPRPRVRSAPLRAARPAPVRPAAVCRRSQVRAGRDRDARAARRRAARAPHVHGRVPVLLLRGGRVLGPRLHAARGREVRRPAADLRSRTPTGGRCSWGTRSARRGTSPRRAT